MLIASFHLGPFDGRRILLPTEEPWPKFVIPRWGTIQLEVFYLLAGRLDETIWAYLWDDSFGGITSDDQPPVPGL